MSLFSYLPVQIETCNEEQLIFVSENDHITADFFNLLFYDTDSRIKACSYLNDAKKIELEEEQNTENGYYIYADDKLFQEVAVELGWARINFEYEGYAHHFEEKEVIAMAADMPKPAALRSYFLLGSICILLLICILAAIKL